MEDTVVTHEKLDNNTKKIKIPMFARTSELSALTPVKYLEMKVQNSFCDDI